MKNILLLGDSIRQGYDHYVKMAFDGVAEVFYPSENCRFSTFFLRHLGDWKNALVRDVRIDLVHWNAGLWDCLLMPDGLPLVDREEYTKNIERICNIIPLYFPQSSMIFATSTPVQEELFVDYKRYNKTIELYNESAAKIVLKHGGEINDLYTLMTEQPVEYHSDRTHYYTKEGTRVITTQVIQCIEKSLGISAAPLDYNRLFGEPKDIKGL